MKISIILLIIFSSVLCVSAQENSAGKWMRVETENKEISVSFPPGFIVDAGKRGFTQIHRIVGYQNSVNMEMRIFKEKNAENMLNGIISKEGKSSNFTSNGLKGRRTVLAENEHFFETIHLASKDYLYFFRVEAASSKKDEVKRFLFSIKINGKPMYAQTDKTDFPEDVVSVKTLKTSPEVTEALNRKYEKQKIKVTNKPLADFKNVEDFTQDVRPPIILDSFIVDFRQRIDRNVPVNTTYSAWLKVTFLASGQVGDITAFSNDRGILALSEDDKTFIDACVDATRKTKFIPAQSGGKNVDAVKAIYFSMEVTASLERQ